MSGLFSNFDTLSLLKYPNERLEKLAHLTGADIGGIRLIASLLLSFVFQTLFLIILTNRSVKIKNGYFIIVGISILIFNYGWNVLHFIVSALTVYTTLNLLPVSSSTVTFNFLFVFGYLMAGYWSHLSNDYSFEWTIGHCVLTLRLIGITFDVFDNYHNKIKDKDHNNPLLDFSSFFAFCFFPSTILTGPQFNFKQYQTFVNQNEFKLKDINVCFRTSFKRLIVGLLYLAMFQLGSLYLPLTLLNSPSYQSKSFVTRCALVGLVTRIHLYKYLSSWILAEAASIASGLTYQCDNKSFWSVTNVHCIQYETACSFTEIIKSFNVTTNLWCSNYIYKRLKFLKMRFVSHFATLSFLAFWHGWKSGYYVTFFLEFLIVTVEKDIKQFWNGLKGKYVNFNKIVSNPFVDKILSIIMHVFTFSIFGYCLLPFIMLTHMKYLPLLSDLFYIGHVLPFVWIIMSSFIKKISFNDTKVKSN